MKKRILTGFLAIASYALHAQTYYPSGKDTIPTWGYDYVVSDGDGRFYNPKTHKSGSVIDDAELNFATFNRGDAYDGAFEFFINTQDSAYTESGLADGLVDTVGTTITLAEQLIDSFYVSKQYYFSPTTPVVRAIFKIRNPYTTARTAKVGIYTNMGSDNETVVDTSFTGSDTLTNADRWMVTTDNHAYDQGDPINTWVRFGPGTVTSPPIFGQKPASNSDDYLDTVVVTVPANSYRLVMQINRLDSTQAAARANIGAFNTNESVIAAGYLEGISTADLGKIVNWNFCNPVSVENPQSICATGSYVINGHTYTVAGVYSDTLQKAMGCDSIVVTQLTIKSATSILTQPASQTICGGNFASLLVSATGENLTYTWSNGEATTSVSSSVAGAYMITVSGTCGIEVSSEAQLVVLNCNTVTGVNSGVEVENKLTVYPNPNSGFFFVQSYQTTTVSYQLLDLLGRTVGTGSLKYGVNEIDLSVQKGIYYLKSGQSVQKVIIE